MILLPYKSCSCSHSLYSRTSLHRKPVGLVKIQLTWPESPRSLVYLWIAVPYGVQREAWYSQNSSDLRRRVDFYTRLFSILRNLQGAYNCLSLPLPTIDTLQGKWDWEISKRTVKAPENTLTSQHTQSCPAFGLDLTKPFLWMNKKLSAECVLWTPTLPLQPQILP